MINKLYIENPKNGLVKKIWTAYSADADITTIFEDICYMNTDVLISTEIKGFYYGLPNDEYTKEYYDEMKAEF